MAISSTEGPSSKYSNPLAGEGKIVQQADKNDPTMHPFGVDVKKTAKQAGKWITGEHGLYGDLTKSMDVGRIEGQADSAQYQFGGMGDRNQQLYGAMGAAAQGRGGLQAAPTRIEAGSANSQEALLQSLQNRATGGTASQAELQMRAGQEANAAAMMAMAKAQRGGGAQARQHQLQGQLAQSNMQTIQQAAALRAGEQAQAERSMAGVLGQMQQGELGRSQMRQRTDLANLDAGLQQRQMNDRMQQLMTQYGLSADEAEMQAAADLEQARMGAESERQRVNFEIAKQNLEQEKFEKESGVGGIMGVFKGISKISDERAKENVKDANDDIEEFLGSIEPKSFDYKKKYGDKGYTGFMAQDIERSRTGRQMVAEGKDGLKRFDTGRALMAAMAGLGNLNRRLKAVEG